MDKDQFGAFVAENRKALGLTQKDLASRLHVTDKAVSKWERGLSYPDVTLLEPLAEALRMGVTELVACREKQQETDDCTAEKEEQMANTLLSISADSLRAERGRRRKWIAALTIMLAVLLAGLLIAWQSSFVTEQDTRAILYKETVGGKRYIYVEEDGHLLRLKCGEGVDYDTIDLERTDGPEEPMWELAYCWNRRTHRGVVSRCDRSAVISWGPMDEVGASIDLSVVGNDALFGCRSVMMEIVDRYPNPHGDGYLSTYTFRCGGKALLTVEDCLGFIAPSYDGGFIQVDADGDGTTELLARTKWPEKPYILYDREDGVLTETWLDRFPPGLEGT